MSDLLDGLGLEPEGQPEQPAVEPAEQPVVEAPEPEAEEIVVPEGAQNPDAVRNAIAAERASARAAYKKAKDLERQLAEREEASKPLEERLSTASKRAEEAELKALRIEVGVENGLSLSLARRLSGTDRAEIEADAKALAAELGDRPKPQLPGLDGGHKPGPAPVTDPGQAHNQFLGRILGRTGA